MDEPARRTSLLARYWHSRARDLTVLLLVAASLVSLRVVTTRDSSEETERGATAPLTTESPRVITPPQAVVPSGPVVERKKWKCVTPTKTTQLTVVTYNIKSARFGGYSRLSQIAAELADTDADIVLLQEVDRNRYLSGRVAQPDELSEALGFQYAFGLNVLRPGDSEYGTAILSRFPIESSVNTALPNRAGMQQRGLLHITVQVDGMPVSIYTTHLQNTSRSMRVEQMGRVVQLLGDDPLPTIIGGDLNDTPASPVLASAYSALSDTWSAVGSGQGATAPAGNPRARIDYLLYQQGDDPKTVLTPESAEVLGVGSSDHRAVRATYDLTETQPEVCVPIDQPAS
jgi:endonuclease/exonuclease/phosphatase family metal-dependent hydrolase